VSVSINALAAVRRSNQAYYEQITEQHTLNCGIAFMCPQFPELYDGNHLREVIIPPKQSLAEAFDEVEAIFRSRGLQCYRWVPAAGTPIEPIETFLVSRGFRSAHELAMVLTREVQIPARSDIRIAPARAMRKALREIKLADTRYHESKRPMLADAKNERLDDPQYDMFIATVDGAPAATGTLFQVGDIGSIQDIFVTEPFRRQGVGLAMMHYLLSLSRRLAMRITVLEVSPDNQPAIALYQRCGFEPGGSYVEFLAPSVLL